MLKRIPFHWQTLGAMALGALLGVWAGPSIAPLGKLGAVLIQIIKALATPLLFFVLLDSFLKSAIKGRAFLIMLAVCLFNAFCAVLIAIVVADVWKPGVALRGMLTQTSANLAPPQDLWVALLSYLPLNLLQPFIEHSIPGAILLAILFGLAFRSMAKQGKKIDGVQQGVQTAVDVLLEAVGLVVKFSPIAVFAVAAQSVGEKGLAPMAGLLGYVGSTCAGMAIQIFVVYQAWIAWSGINVFNFWKRAKEPMLYAFGVNSSLATLPVTFRALDQLKVSPTASRLGAGLGTNFNNDGILLYEAMAVIIVAQAYGMQLSLWQQAGLALTCVVTAFGVAGVPEAGIIALTLVLSSADISTEILPLLLTVDWVVARCRSATNVVGDMTTSIVLDRFIARKPRFSKAA